jgi:hypothetical protein
MGISRNRPARKERTCYMQNRDNHLEKMALGAGTWMLISGVLILGPVGFLLLLAVFYSMMVQNLALGVVAGLLISSPVILFGIWASLKWTAVLREHVARKAEFVRRSQPIPEFERD